jgi:hypothetical protein
MSPNTTFGSAQKKRPVPIATTTQTVKSRSIKEAATKQSRRFIGQLDSLLVRLGLAAVLLLGFSVPPASADDLGAFTTIDFPGAATTTAKAINSNGDVVGFYKDSAGALLPRPAPTLIRP